MISILMAAKTSTEFMDQAIGSVIGQSYTDWELIIGVNGLPENDPVYVRAMGWAAMFPGKILALQYPDARNKGEALNQMVEHARGEYVAILDVDDLWHPRKLEWQVDEMRINGADVLGTCGSYFGASNDRINVPLGDVWFDYLRRQNGILNSSVLMDRKLARWEPMDQPLEDYEMWLRLASEGKRLMNSFGILTFIRCHPGQWGHSTYQTAIDELRARYAK